MNKQFIRSKIEYCSTSWAARLADAHYESLQRTQNTALRIATGCTSKTSIDHLHDETKLLKIRYNMDLEGTQIYDRITNDNTNPLDHTLHIPQTPRDIKALSSKHYKDMLNTIPTPSNNTSRSTHIHNILAKRSINSLKPNTILVTRPPDVNDFELELGRGE